MSTSPHSLSLGSCAASVSQRVSIRRTQSGSVLPAVGAHEVDRFEDEDGQQTIAYELDLLLDGGVLEELLEDVEHERNVGVAILAREHQRLLRGAVEGSLHREALQAEHLVHVVVLRAEQRCDVLKLLGLALGVATLGRLRIHERRAGDELAAGLGDQLKGTEQLLVVGRFELVGFVDRDSRERGLGGYLEVCSRRADEVVRGAV